MEFVTPKFVAVVMDDGDKSRVTTKLFGDEKFGDVRGGEAFCDYKFRPCSCSVYYGVYVYHFSKDLFCLGKSELHFPGSDHACVDGCPMDYVI